jgi:hypothetical protein
MSMYQETHYNATDLENEVVSWFVFHSLSVYMPEQGHSEE